MRHSYWSIEEIFKYCDIPDGNLIEFGVYKGTYLEQLIKGKNFDEIYGFDSFTGIPSNSDGNPDWCEGAFSWVKDGGFSSTEEAVRDVYKRIDHPNLHLIAGWFKDTLTKNLGQQLENTCSYSHIDVDISSSTKECFEWLLKYKVMKIGGLIRFDDWVSGLSYGAGNPKAFAIVTNKYQPILERIAINVFKLLDYGI